MDEQLHQHYLFFKRQLDTEFGLRELWDIALELGMNPEHWPHQTLPQLVDGLLRMVDRGRHHQELVVILRRERPSIPWPDTYRYPRGPEAEEQRPPAPYAPPPKPDDWSEMQAPGPLPPGSFPLYEPNPLFTGREGELRTLAETLLGESDGRPLAITTSGMGGVGKTQLAVEFAWRYGRWFPGGVFWISFADESEGAIRAAIAASGQYLELAGYEGGELAQQVALVQRAWHEPTARLLIFDNCEDARLLAAWKPKQGGCRVLVTSRKGEWPKDMGLRRMPLRTLPRPQSVELLARYLNTPERPLPASYRQLLAEHPLLVADLEAIAAELGDLPLALRLAGSYLDYDRDTTPGDYLRALRDPDLLAHPSFQEEWAKEWVEVDAVGYVPDLRRSIQLSLERLKKEGREWEEPTLAVLARAAQFAPGEPFPQPLLLAAVKEDGENEGRSKAVLRRLVNLGLLEVEDGATTGEQTARLHRLVAAFVRDFVTDARAQADVEQAVTALAYKQNMAGHPAALRAWDVHLRHVTGAALQREDNQAAALATNVGYYLRMSGDLAGARPYYEQALAIRERVLGGDHPDTARSLNNLGYLLKAQGDLARARPYYEQALAIKERVLGGDHPATASSLNNLGSLLDDLGDLAGARPYYEQALAIRERVLGGDHPDTARSLNNLGYLLKAQGDLARARPYYEQALAIKERVLGGDHPATATSLNNLGYLLKAQGDLARARPYYEQALAISERVLGRDHPATATSLNNLGALLRAQGDLAGARPYYEQALAIRERVLGGDHPDTAYSLNNLGLLLAAEGERATAKAYLQRAVAILETKLGPDHPITRQGRANLEGL